MKVRNRHLLLALAFSVVGYFVWRFLDKHVPDSAIP